VERKDRSTAVVVGGGIGGMATALSLSRAGIPVHLLERAAEFSEVGAGIQVGPNVMRMLDVLGVLPEIREIAFFPRTLTLMDALDGSGVTSVDLGAAFVDRFGYPYATIHRADLHEVLVRACAASPLVRLETEQTVTGYDQTDEGVVVRTARGEEISGSVLIGADGIWSTIRESLVGDGDPRMTGHIAYRAVLPMTEIPEDLRSDSVVLWAGPNLHLAHYPLRRGELFNMGAIFHSDRFLDGADVYGDPDELHAKFAGVHPDVATLLGKIEEWRMWVLRDRDPDDRWIDRRVALLGDSAHPTLQYMAQGAGMAIEDAVVLARTLSASAPGQVPSALHDYAEERFSRTSRVTLTSRLFGQLFHASGAERVVRRDMLADWSTQSAHQSFAWLYDGIDAVGARGTTTQETVA
jgi:salicylate hydroxylase